MKKIFDETTGYLLLDELVFNRSSFQAIMEDHTITDDEIIKQANAVVALLKKMDAKLDAEEKELVIDVISEIAVLYQINSIKGGK